MKVSPGSEFSKRKFVSIGLFLTTIVLFATAVIIQIFEDNNDFFTELFTITHIFTGLTFTILSAIHAKLNWQAIKAYVKSKDLKISKEAIYASVLVMSSTITGMIMSVL